MAGGPSIGATALHLSADDSKFKKGLDSAGSRFKRFKSELVQDAKDIKAGVEMAFGFIGGLAAAGGGLFAGLSLTNLVTDSVKLAGEMEDIAASFKTMAADASGGEDLFRAIEAAADEMRVSIKDAATAAQGLLAADVADDHIVPTLRLLGDLAGGDAEKLKALALAYARVRDEGIVTSKTLQSFRGQGVFLGDELARQLGVERGELPRLLAEGVVEFADLHRAIVAATSEGGRFFGFLEARAQTFAGKVDALGNAWSDFKWELGKVIIEETGLGDLFDRLTATVKAGESGLDSWRPIIRDVAGFAKDIGRDLYEGGWAFVRAMAQAKDLIGDVGGSWVNVKMRLQEVFPGWAVLWNTLGSGGPAGGPAEQAVLDAKKRADEIWKGMAGAGGQGGGMGNYFKDAGEILGKSASRAIRDGLKEADWKKIAGIKDEFDPIGKAARELAELKRLQGKGGFVQRDADGAKILGGPDFFGLAAAKILAGLLDKETKFDAPNVAAKDSREAVEAIIRAMQPVGPKPEDKVAEILERIRGLNADGKNQLEEIKRILNEMLKKAPGVM